MRPRAPRLRRPSSRGRRSHLNFGSVSSEPQWDMFSEDTLARRLVVAFTAGLFAFASDAGLQSFLLHRARVRTELPEAVVLVPVALAMLGGPFVHDVQIAAAVPALIVLAPRYWLARIAVRSPRRRVELLVASLTRGHRCRSVRCRDGRLSAARSPVLGRLRLRSDAPGHRHVACVADVSGRRTLGRRRGTGAAGPAARLLFASVGLENKLVPAANAVNARNVVEKFPTWIALVLIPVLLLSGSELRAARPATSPT